MKRKNLKAYVRLDKNGQPIGGSMIYRDKQPYGKFKPLLNPYGDVCCPPLPQGCANTQSFGTTGSGVYEGGMHHAVDADCNTYFAYWVGPGETGFFQEVAVLKRDKDGNILWNVRTSFTEAPAYNYSTNGWAASLEFDNVNGRLFLLSGSGALVAFDSNGTVLYSKMPNYAAINSTSYVIGFFPGKFAVSPDGNFLYVTILGKQVISNVFENASQILKIDAATGNVLKQLRLNIYEEGDNENVGSGIYGADCDENGDVYVTVNWYTPGFQSRGVIIKYDSNLVQVWRTQVYGESFDAPRALNGVFATMANSEKVLTLNTTTGGVSWYGQLIKAAEMNNFYFNDIRIDSANNLYLIGTTSFNSNPPLRQINVIKMLADGSSPEFIYRIDDSRGASNNYWGFTGVQGPNVTSSALLIPYFSINRAQQDSLELKLGLENQVGVSAGPYTIVDASSSGTWSLQVPFIVGNPVFSTVEETNIATNWDTVTCTLLPSPTSFTIVNLN